MDTPCESFSGGERARLALALIVWKRPNVLILDEPTNHLDLDMRHALTMALQDFEGAVVLVSHERQLIASVCDELLVVHDGICKPFAGDLSDYADWLRQVRQEMQQRERLERQQEKAKPTPVVAAPVLVATPAPVVDKEAARKESAARREQTRPLRKQIETLEQKIVTINQQLSQLEHTLADATLYDADRKADLLKHMEHQQSLKAQLETHDHQLLEQMLELDTLMAD
jgi:ATP-binding cassette subfamily F protein 3